MLRCVLLNPREMEDHIEKKEIENFKRIYHQFKINTELLNKKGSDLKDLIIKRLSGVAVDNLPEGKLRGIYFISYVKKLDPWSAIDYKDGTDPQTTPLLASGTSVPDLDAFVCSHTNIEIEATNNDRVIKSADLRGFMRENWGISGYKEIPFDLKSSERVEIKWNTEGNDFPPCGEFIFVIDQPIICGI